MVGLSSLLSEEEGKRRKSKGTKRKGDTLVVLIASVCYDGEEEGFLVCCVALYCEEEEQNFASFIHIYLQWLNSGMQQMHPKQHRIWIMHWSMEERYVVGWQMRETWGCMYPTFLLLSFLSSSVCCLSASLLSSIPLPPFSLLSHSPFPSFSLLMSLHLPLTLSSHSSSSYSSSRSSSRSSSHPSSCSSSSYSSSHFFFF